MDTLTKNDLEPIQKAVESLTQSARRIETALLGDKEMKLEGIADKVSNHQKYIEKSKTRIGWITGASTGLGFVIHQIVDWFKSNP